MSPTTVLVLHRNRLLRECLRNALGVSYEALELDHSEEQFDDRLAACQLDVVIVDLSLPTGLAIELTQRVLQEHPAAKVVALVPEDRQEMVVDGISAGAHGCVLEESTLDELHLAISRVLAGEHFCSPEIVRSMFAQLNQLGRQADWRQRAANIDVTPRELEVLELISRRYTNRQIAERLAVSLYTVKNHVHNILDKLQVTDRNEAVQHALDRRWFAS